MIRLILHYCDVDFYDCQVTMEEFGSRKLAGDIEYGVLPILTLKNGTKLHQSEAIARYLGRTYRGSNNEVLYPSNKEPGLMHQIDQVMELATSLLSKYAPFTIPFLPTYRYKQDLLLNFMDDVFPAFLA